MQSIEEYVKERDIAILGTLQEYMAFAKKNGIDMDPFIAEISQHKSRITINAASEKIKEQSKKWLVDRGYKSGLF